MKKQFALMLLLATLLPFAACKKDAEINAILAEFDSFTTEMVKRVESAPNPSAGVDDAQKYFDSNKAKVMARMDAIKGLRGYQVSKETEEKMTTSLVADASKVAGLEIKYVIKSVSTT